MSKNVYKYIIIRVANISSINFYLLMACDSEIVYLFVINTDHKA